MSETCRPCHWCDDGGDCIAPTPEYATIESSNWVVKYQQDLAKDCVLFVKKKASPSDTEVSDD